MFINKTSEGENNLCGKRVAVLRKSKGLSQNKLASLLQINGLDIDKNAIQRIECGKRFVTDIELAYLAKTLDTSFDTLINNKNLNTDPIFKKRSLN